MRRVQLCCFASRMPGCLDHTSSLISAKEAVLCNPIQDPTTVCVSDSCRFGSA